VVKLYDLRLEKQITQWHAHANTIREQPDWNHHAIVFAPDGSTIITAGSDAAVRFWQLGTNVALVHESMGLGDGVVRLAISPDGSTLAGQCFSEIVYLWRLRPGAAIGPVEIPCPGFALPGGIAFSPDGGKLLVGWGYNPISQYDLSIPDRPRQLPPLPDTNPFFAFSPDGRWLVCLGPNRHIIRRWSWPSGQALPEIVVEGGSVDSLAISADSQQLAAGLMGGQIDVWSLTNRGAQVATILQGHEQSAVKVAFGQGTAGPELISASTDKTIRTWNAAAPRSKERVLQLEAPVLAVAVSPDGENLATVTRVFPGPNQKDPPKPFLLRLRDRELRPRGTAIPFGGNGLDPKAVFSPDGKLLGVTDSGKLELYEVPSLTLKARPGTRGLVFAPNGTLLYLDKRGIIQRSSLDSSEKVVVAGKGDLQELALSPDGHTLAGSEPYGARIWRWDLRDGRSLGQPLVGHTARIPSIEFSRDGQILVSAGWDGRLAFWDVARSQPLRLRRAHNGEITTAVLSPDGTTVATGGGDSSVRLWNLARREEIAVLRGHTATVNSVAFSKDGRWLASASDDGTVRFWDASLQSDFKVGGTP
jgi:WD40 repeat protein